VTPELFARAETGREGRPLVVLDLALPRRLPPRDRHPARRLAVFDRRPRRRRCEANRRSRQREMPALAIVDEETRRFMGDLHHRSTAPVIERLAGWLDGDG